jgi:hypothetical protein
MLTLAAALLTGCAASPPPASVPIEGPPWVGLSPDGRYLTVDGRTQPVLMRNVSAPSVAQFIQFLDAARSAGVRVVRIQLTQGLGYTLGIRADGAVDAGWASDWDRVIDAAGARGISVIPVFAIWGDWNDGKPDYGWAKDAIAFRIAPSW